MVAPSQSLCNAPLLLAVRAGGKPQVETTSWSSTENNPMSEGGPEPRRTPARRMVRVFYSSAGIS